MKVLKATLEQKKQLEGTYLNGAVLQFIQDSKDNWVVNVNVLTDHSFEAIHADLSNLPEINYVPKIIEIL
jgi:hypothetical protein